MQHLRVGTRQLGLIRIIKRTSNNSNDLTCTEARLLVMRYDVLSFVQIVFLEFEVRDMFTKVGTVTLANAKAN